MRGRLQSSALWRQAGRCALAVVFMLALPALAAPGKARVPGRTHVVTIEALKFSPDIIVVAPGDTVIWTNKDPFPHTATTSEKGFDSGEIKPNRSWKFTARKKGEFRYICTLHPSMKGTLVVK